MEFFADRDAIATFAARIDPAATPQKRAALAWLLRQAQPAEALALAANHENASARAALVHAEAAIHQGAYDAAGEHIQQARQLASDDALALLDASLLSAMLASSRGQAPAALTQADALAGRATELGHRDRAEIATAFAALVSVYAAPAEAVARLESLESRELGPVAGVYTRVTRCMHDFNRGDHGAVARRLEPLIAEAHRLGMLQLQLRLQNTLAAAYSNLDDKGTAISWVERSIEQARAAGWPIATGEALSFLGNFYREAGHGARALEILEDARRSLSTAPGSRGYALACCYLAHAHLAAGNTGPAAEFASEADAVARAIQATPIVIDVLTVAARARARMGQAQRAAELAHRALELAREHDLPVWSIDALRALAEIHAGHAVALPPGLAPEQAPLFYLQQAREIATSMGGHSEQVNILRELARAHERAGHLAEALATERSALDHALSEDAKRINNRLLAVEARHQVERQRLETEHERQVAAAQAARAQALDEANVELRRAHTELETLANTDPLTGIANRRSFLALAEDEVQRTLRYQRIVGLVLCDIDRFKAINDSLGHPCGDQVIIAAARTLAAGLRTTDRLGRIGGEEFALLLPETDLQTSYAVADRLRAAIQSCRVEWEGKPVHFTMSFGVAVLGGIDPFTKEGTIADTLEALVRRVDGALYEAKAAGRNRVARR